MSAKLGIAAAVGAALLEGASFCPAAPAVLPDAAAILLYLQSPTAAHLQTCVELSDYWCVQSVNHSERLAQRR